MVPVDTPGAHAAERTMDAYLSRSPTRYPEIAGDLRDGGVRKLRQRRTSGLFASLGQIRRKAECGEFEACDIGLDDEVGRLHAEGVDAVALDQKTAQQRLDG